MTEHRLISAAAELAHWPGVAARLLDIHVPGPDGCCRGCATQARPAPRWPCRLAILASRAAGKALPAR